MARKQLAAALKDAGLPDHREQLAVLARDVLSRSGMDYEKARAGLWLSVSGMPDLLYTMIANGPEAARNALLDAVLAPVADEMRGRGAGLHAIPNAVTPPSSAANAGRRKDGALHERAGTGARGPWLSDVHTSTASPPAPLDHAHASEVVALSVLDSFHIIERQGSKTRIGDIPVARYDRLTKWFGRAAWARSREFYLFTMLQAEARKQAHIPADAKTRDIFGADQIAALIETATAMSLPAIPEPERKAAEEEYNAA